jgi:NIMA-interacting peptidyl-prolyl cis-trans isomerase 1
MAGRLPPSWTVKDRDSRVLYKNAQYAQWVRPVPPPGIEGDWPPFLHPAHILIKHHQVRNPRSRNKTKSEQRITRSSAQALAEIRAIRDDLIAHNHTFELLAAQKSDCPSYSESGDLGWSLCRSLHPDFVRAALALNFGEISEPIQTPSGWHLIRRLDGVPVEEERSLKPPPPIAMEFGLDDNLIRSVDPKVIRDLMRYLLEVEHTPLNRIAWFHLIDTYIKVCNTMTPVLRRYIYSLLYFHPNDEKSVTKVIEVLERYQGPGVGAPILRQVLRYTWNASFWNFWFALEDANLTREDRLLMRRQMFEKVGFAIDTVALWSDYIKFLTAEGEPRERVLSELKRGLMIGLSNPGPLLDLLEELEPESKAEWRGRQMKLLSVVARRGVVQEDARRGFVESSQDSRMHRFRDFLDEEARNPLDHPRPVFLMAMDFNYRLVLAALWWHPSIWMEYWSFLVENGRAEDADTVLTLGRGAVGDTPLFEMRRADHLLRCRRFDEGVAILENLLTCQDPLRTAAMTLLFRATADFHTEEEALKIITKHGHAARPQFFVNAARLCKSEKVAWTIFELGVDRFPSDDNLVVAAAEFLEQHRDVRNTRLLFQQALKESGRRFDIKRRLFEFEVDHIAPLDHLNETQKVFNKTGVDPLVLYMQRYRFLDLYPLGTDELRALGHLAPVGSVDLVDNTPDAPALTSVTPYGTDPRELVRLASWQEIVAQNVRRASAPEIQMGQEKPNRIPPALHNLLKQIGDQPLHFAPPGVDQVIETVERFALRVQYGRH